MVSQVEGIWVQEVMVLFSWDHPSKVFMCSVTDGIVGLKDCGHECTDHVAQASITPPPSFWSWGLQSA